MTEDKSDMGPCPQCNAGSRDQLFLGMLKDEGTYRCTRCGWTYFASEAGSGCAIWVSPRGDHWLEHEGAARRIVVTRAMAYGADPLAYIGTLHRQEMRNLYHEGGR